MKNVFREMSSLPTVFFSDDPVVSFKLVDLPPPFCAWFRLPFSTGGMPAADSSHLRAPWELCSCPGRLHVSHELKRRIPLPYVLLFVAIVIYISYKKIYRRILHENLRAFRSIRQLTNREQRASGVYVGNGDVM